MWYDTVEEGDMWCDRRRGVHTFVYLVVDVDQSQGNNDNWICII